MRSANLDDLPNPFSVQQSGPRGSRSSIVRSLKVGLLACGLLALVAFGQRLANQQRINHLKTQFQHLSSSEKLTALITLESEGSDASPILVAAILDEDEEVAIKAYEVLRSLQNEWVVLEPEIAAEHHHLLMDSIGNVTTHQLPDTRRNLLVTLVEQTTQASLSATNTRMAELSIRAARALQTLAAHRDVSTESFDPMGPLPITEALAQTDWTDWPPAMLDSFDAETALASHSTESDQSTATVLPEAQLIPSRPERNSLVKHADHYTPLPVVYRTESALKAITTNAPIVLKNSPATRVQPVTTHQAEESESQPPSPSRTPNETTDSAELGHLSQLSLHQLYKLDESRNRVSPNVRTELEQRGISADQIDVGRLVTCGSPQEKVQWLATQDSATEDTRRWFLLLLAHGEREVKLRTISAIDRLNDATMRQHLRLHLVSEEDQAVVFRIRRILNLR